MTRIMRWPWTVTALIALGLGLTLGIARCEGSGPHPFTTTAARTTSTPARAPQGPLTIGFIFPGHSRQNIAWTVAGPTHVPSLTYPQYANGTGEWASFQCAGSYGLDTHRWYLTCIWKPGTR